MKKITILFYFVLFSFKLSFSQLVSFDFNSSPYLNVTLSDSKVTSTPLMISSGTIGTNKTTSAFADLPYVEATGGWTATSVASAKYFYVTFTAIPGYWIQLSAVSFETVVTSAGPSDISILINDSLVFTGAAPLLVDTIQQILTGFDSLPSVSIKLAGWNNGSRVSTGTGAFRIDNVKVLGVVEMIPLKDSSSTLTLNNFEVPAKISSLQSGTNILKIAELIFTDSASGDGDPTYIDSFFISPSVFNQFPDWNQIIDQVQIKGPDFPEGLKGKVFPKEIGFITPATFQIAEGSENAEVYELSISLNDTLGLADNKHLGLKCEVTNIYCNPLGSKVGFSNIIVPQQKLRVDIQATRSIVDFPNELIFIDSLFSIGISATDTFGNRDTDIGSLVSLAVSSGEAVFHSGNALQRDFDSGYCQFSDLWFTGTDTVIFTITTDDFLPQVSDVVLIGEPKVFENFEKSSDNLWQASSDWEVSSVNPISGQWSLQHLPADEAGISFLTGTYSGEFVNTGKTVWRMILKNGDFDPTSSNRFWYYLLASDSNLVATDIAGYAVGVNMSGSSDSLSLWKINSDGSRQVLIKTQCDWNAKDTIAIEVIRNVPGYWQMGWKRGTNFKELHNSDLIIDSVFTNLPYHGLVYQFSSTRSGQLWADDINFFRINSPPFLLKANAMDEKTIRLFFSEEISPEESFNTENIIIETTSSEKPVIDSVELNPLNAKEILVYVNRLMTSGYTITINQLTDNEGSFMFEQSADFSFRVPAKWGDVVVNEILFDPSPVVGLPEYDFLELYNQGENPFYLGNWKLKIGDIIKNLPDTVIDKGKYLIVTSSTAQNFYSQFGNVMPLISTTDLTNTGKPILLFTEKGVLTDSLFYQPSWITDVNKQEGGWSLERIDPLNACSASANWKASIDSLGGTPGTQNSVYSQNIDTQLPLLLSHHLISPFEIELSFSEEIQPLLDENPDELFTLHPDIEIDSLRISEDRTIITLLLEESLAVDSLYKLSVQKISDLCGNRLTDTIIELFFHETKPFDIVFNEIMADPTPAIGLPESDYLELYNRSSFEIQLFEWEIWSGSVRKVLPEYLLKPGEYLLLSQSGYEIQYSDTLSKLGILSSTFLPSAGQTLVLNDSKGKKIDSLTYSPAWYHNPEKEDGGWSVERLNTDNFCSTFFNWKASENEIGGTPGFQNSVKQNYVDSLSPKVATSQIYTTRSILITLNEPVEIITRENFELLHSLGYPDSVNVWDDNFLAIELIFNQPFESPVTYQLKVNGLKDNCGNQLNDTLMALFYYEPNADDIIINEIMADPVPSVLLPEVAYIELYNRSNWPINLEGWTLFYGDYYRQLTSFLLKPKDYLLLCPTGGASAFDEFGDVMDVLSSTTLTSTGKLLQLYDSSGLLINRVDYRKSWYADADKEDGGWALERIDPENVCSNSFNWKASISANGGTPSQQNSVFCANPDTLKPKVKYLKVLDNQRFAVEFSESISKNLLSDSLHYLIHGSYCSIMSVNEDVGSIVLKRADPFMVGYTYTLKITGITDDCDNPMNDTLIQFSFNAVEPNHIVFTEIFADESPVVGLPEYEYLEIVNLSQNNIDLEGWELMVGSSRKTLSRVLFAPQSRLILTTPDGAGALERFGQTLPVEGFPSLPNQGTLLQLLDTSGVVISKLAYSDSWYNDSGKDNGGWSIEIIDPENFCSQQANWSASVNLLGGTPGTVNSVNKKNIDEVPPHIKNLIPADIHKIWIEFSEIPSVEPKLNRLNYLLEQAGNPVQILEDSTNASRVLLIFDDSLVSNTIYQLLIKNLEDDCGNILTDTTLNFQYYVPVLYDIVINELMTTPEPSMGLPGKEYLELFNTSNQGIHLYNFTLVVGSSTRKIPYYFFPADSYLLLTHPENKELFDEFGSVLAVDDFPTLANSGKVHLFAPENAFICGTEWHSDWITDEFKANGGFSLERIDPMNANETDENWKPNESEVGGTPGGQNSVYRSNPDEIPPQLLRAIPMNDTLIRLEFSEPIRKASLVLNQFILNGVTGKFTGYISYEPDLWYFDILIAEQLKTGTTYTLTLNDDITDISGNGIINTSTFFAKPGQATSNDLVINELLYNPGSQSTDFVELYNRSSSPVNLKQFFLATRKTDGTIDQLKVISDFGAIVFPGEYVVLSTDQLLIKQSYWVKNKMAFYDMDGLPSFPDDEGVVVLLDTLGIIIDEFNYTDDMQFALLQSTEGVSLERIHYNRPAQETSNWHSAAESVGWATPGYENSVFMEQVERNQEIWIEPELFSPNSDGYNDVVNLHYLFLEPGYVANVTIFSEKGKQIRNLIQNELLATKGVISWDGLSDDQTKAPVGIYILFIEVFTIDGHSKQFKKVCVNTE